ncbi:hypothetical protein ABH920_003319 [Catenulispora sp. EB89]
MSDVDVATAAVQARDGNDELTDYSFHDAPLGSLLEAGPWRTFRWHLG